ncbi:hypothetical protein C7N43_19290 [Sphingobacteriales bacterium UPWRP_1]|nr:hypothetical protein BVG80_13625 [Sphingobacteriales bacterium TSM_CSM]PSJ75363.1 hypothetical protein C7N43_19290 [Sphingobacteriales bacterium UPWRP_1]
MSSLGTRVVTAMALAAVALTCLFTSHYLLMLLLMAFTVGGIWEFTTLSHLYPGVLPQNPLSDKLLAAATGLVVYLLVSGILLGLVPAVMWVVLMPLLLLLGIREMYVHPHGLFLRFCLLVSGILYIAVPLAMVNAIAHFGGTYQPRLVLGVFFLIWANDTGAYFAGRFFGKTPLFKTISPKKTWEGSVGGLLLTLAVAFAAAQLLPQLSLPVWLGIAFFSVTIGTWGDLAESMLKRNVGVKDSGNILPGHGGILDRLDAVFFVIPFVWAWLQLAHAL